MSNEVPVEVPAEPVYYYECSRGEFRLLYFIPSNELERLADGGECAQQALADYPDGVDLTCSESHFSDFKETYGYRPKHDPEDLCNAFYALWTSTKDWHDGTISGFLPAKVIEEHLTQISLATPTTRSVPRAKPRRVEASVQDRRTYQHEMEATQESLEANLRNFQPEAVTQDLQLNEQAFNKIHMEKGIPVADLFIRLSQNMEEK